MLLVLFSWSGQITLPDPDIARLLQESLVEFVTPPLSLGYRLTTEGVEIARRIGRMAQS
ncbi:hypothetical protein F4827_006616 [Paraburkholderia bannensis]|uniref:Uncharacterized protein n=1 Tax=Paraburkholderia bannensis TaxID=765414 RepID=A0A7W9WUT1_9BURK|nr:MULTISPECIES: hypothetical protein [Paraburkholderia]MBB3261760.1 hypothetical protein [Paraburkholderia sp. WP4_3_2]MBB6106740.1 hypothetical protein [Paraburkholderia bannensis]